MSITDNELVVDYDLLTNLFDNNNPIHMEIGMGKGDFILNMAIKYPNINFVGIEKYNELRKEVNI